jgi:hypothetical protein
MYGALTLIYLFKAAKNKLISNAYVLQLMKAPRENYPQAPEVSPLNLSSVSKIQCRGNDGGANLIKFLESHFNSLDVSAMVGPQVREP